MKTNVTKSVKFVSILAPLVVLSAGATMAASINLATGLDASGTVVTTWGGADAHWVVGGHAAQVVTPEYLGWLANSSDSAWIVADVSTTRYNAQDVNNNYLTYSRSFNLNGYDLSTVSLSGSWAVDDSAKLYLNETEISHLDWGNNNFGNFTSFTVLNSLFQPGVNTLSIKMGTSDLYVEGVRLEGVVRGMTAVPEPSTWIYGASSALVMLGEFARKKTK
jgi:hypothetical protein